MNLLHGCKMIESESYQILSYLATGLIEWHNQLTNTKKAYPYPDNIRIGLDKLAAYSIKKRLTFPTDINDAIKLFHQPLKNWPILENSIFEEDACLLSYGQLTDICYELNNTNKDIECEFTQQLILKVMEKCKEQGKQEDYVKFRERIISNVIMEKDKIMSLAINDQSCIAPLIREAYEEIPPSAYYQKQVYLCDQCGWILEWRKGIAYCDCGTVTDNSQLNKIEILQQPSQKWRLKRGLQRYIARPGRHELELAHKLSKKGLEVRLWPNFDTYDLKIIFPDGEIWAVDVKDWSNPYLLAQKLTLIKEEPAWHHAFYVIPQYRKKLCPDYKKILTNSISKREINFGIEMEKDFLKSINSKLKGLGK